MFFSLNFLLPFALYSEYPMSFQWFVNGAQRRAGNTNLS